MGCSIIGIGCWNWILFRCIYWNLIYSVCTCFIKKIDVYIKQHARSMETYIEHNIEFSFRNLVDYIEKRGFDVFEMQRSKIKTLDKDLGVLIFSLDLVKK